MASDYTLFENAGLTSQLAKIKIESFFLVDITSSEYPHWLLESIIRSYSAVIMQLSTTSS
jgi:hypothetical protein